MPVAAAGIQPSRPVIAIAGEDASTLTGGLLAMSASEDVHGLANCELEFGNWGPNGNGPAFLFFDRSLLDFGKQIDVTVAGTTIFSGSITAIEGRFPQGGTPSVAVLAEDRFQDLRMTRRTRTFAEVSDAEAFTSIASDHGLKPELSLEGPTHRVLAQLNQSDLAFMRERARALDAELWLEGTTLKVKPRSARTGTPITLTYGKELRELRVTADLADQATIVNVSGWDVAGKSAVAERADGSLVANELAGGESGPSVLEGAFGARPDAVANAVPFTSAEARARAEALMKRRARRFLVAHGTAETQPEMRVGATLRLAELGPLFNGDFYLAAVRHRFDGNQGLRSELELERPGLGKPS
jgi:phage protein D